MAKERKTLTYKEDTIEKIQELVEDMDGVEHMNTVIDLAVNHFWEDYKEGITGVEYINQTIPEDMIYLIKLEGNTAVYVSNDNGELKREELEL